MVIQILHANPPRFFNEAPENGHALSRAQFDLAGKVRVLPAVPVEQMLKEAYSRSQNIDDHWNAIHPCRSTSIGDVLLVSHNNEVQAYEVVIHGFRKITLMD